MGTFKNTVRVFNLFLCLQIHMAYSTLPFKRLESPAVILLLGLKLFLNVNIILHLFNYTVLFVVVFVKITIIKRKKKKKKDFM